MKNKAGRTIARLMICLPFFAIISCANRVVTSRPTTSDLRDRYLYFLSSLTEDGATNIFMISKTYGLKSQAFAVSLSAAPSVIEDIYRTASEVSTMETVPGGGEDITNVVFDYAIEFPFTNDEIAGCTWWAAKTVKEYVIHRFYDHAPGRAIVDVVFLTKTGLSQVLLFGSKGD